MNINIHGKLFYVTIGFLKLERKQLTLIRFRNIHLNFFGIKKNKKSSKQIRTWHAQLLDLTNYRVADRGLPQKLFWAHLCKSYLSFRLFSSELSQFICDH